MTGPGAGFVEQVYDGAAIRTYLPDCLLVRPRARVRTPPVATVLGLRQRLTAGAARVVGPALVAGTPAYVIAWDSAIASPPVSSRLYVATTEPRLLRIDALERAPAAPAPAVAVLRWPPAPRPVLERSYVPAYDILPRNRRTAELLLPAPALRGPAVPACGRGRAPSDL
jgi:hypothetical protein